MIRIVILLAAVTPPLLVLTYGIAKGRGSWRSEAVWNAFLVGAAGAIVAVSFELLAGHLLPMARLSPLAHAATSAIFLAAIPEEAIKFFVLIGMAEKHVDVRRMQDLLILALAVSLGFATLENFFYVISFGDWRTVASLRAVTAVPEHGIDGLAMGALLIAARQCGPARLAAVPLVPIMLHAAYDLPLFAIEKNLGQGWLAVWLVVIAISSVLAIVLCNRMLRRAVAFDRAAGRDDGSVETSDWLIVGGIAAVVAGPLLLASAFYAKGSAFALVAPVLSIFPIALGIDSIRTGLKRRKLRGERRLATELPASFWS